METAISLEKGVKVDITKTNPGLKKVHLGLGWDVSASGQPAFDLDAFAIGLTDGKWKEEKALVFFNNKKWNGIETFGDNLTGDGDGDDETLAVEFGSVLPEISEVLLCVNIYKAKERKQNFGMVKKAFIRVYDADTKTELAKFDLSEDYSAFTGMIMAKLYRHEGEWKFQAIGEGKNGDITEIATAYK